MTLATVIAAHNDAALEGLTSKGLVRRAHRDFDAGHGSVVEKDRDAAKVLADGQTVNIDARGPAAATCTCPAAGICRHVLLAMLVLRTPADGEDEAPPGPTASEELCSLTETQLRKFAGADWDKAMTLFAAGEAAEITPEEQSLVVRFAELDVSITFIAGQGLRQAAYKGPKTRRRLLTTVAAVLVRQAAGVTTADVDEAAIAPRPQVSARFLDEARMTIQRAVAAVLPGRSEIAHDLLLDLAISTRVESLPRLSAELRGLARQAKLATSRDVSFEADVFLKGAARASALLEGLRVTADDIVLTGTIKRDYQPRGALKLWLLGAARWRSLVGARGVTAYGYAPDEHRWFSVSDGRAAGMDPGFSPANAYLGSLWGKGSMQELIGKSVNLAEPSAAADGSLSMRAGGKAATVGRNIAARSLVESPAASTDWAALRAELAKRMGRGLRRRAVPVPALIAPHGFRGFDFNDLEQVYEWEAIDDAGDSLVLSIPGEDHETAQRLKESGRRIKALLVEASLGPHGLRYRPITAVSDRRQAPEFVNVDFDRWSSRRALKAISRLSDLLKGAKKPAAARIDPLWTIVADTLDALVAKLGRSPTVDLERVRLRAESAGLVSLAAAVREMGVNDNVDSALKAAYIADEIETSLLFRQ